LNVLVDLFAMVTSRFVHHGMNGLRFPVETFL
jgi:hypothetical protein